MMIAQAKSPKNSRGTSAPSASPSIPRIRREVNADRICILTFDRPESRANLFDRAVLEELDHHLDYISTDSDLKGVILASAKKSIFIAGADIHALAGGVTDHDLRGLIAFGQSVFNRLASLTIPTVAAIHGACVGGGFEVCLACDYRIASRERETKIGLPETQLGILPAWGGSARLPRLIGLPKALDIILAGKTLAAPAALRAGLVDELVPREYLLEVAQKRIQQHGAALGKQRPTKKHRLFNNRLVAGIIARKVRKQLQAKTHGHYPAVMKALEVVTRGVGTTMEGALSLEADAMVELTKTAACKNLISVFFLQERAKNLTTKVASNTPVEPIKRVSVIGAGIMGAGIAQWISAREYPVVLKDINEAQVSRGMQSIHDLDQQAVKRHALSRVEARAGLDRIAPATGEVPLGNVDLVIEAAVEKMPLKKEIFAALDRAVAPSAILATNTSALSVDELALSTAHPERVIGLHFFNPVHRMQLVEVVAGARTRPDVLQRALKFVQQIGKLPVVVRDSPGFLVNRVLMPYLVEAGLLFSGGARIEQLDQAMIDFGMPMGPLRLIDEVGVDVSAHVATTLAHHFHDRMTVPPVLSAMIEAGLLGRKSGAGFYLHGKKGQDPKANPAVSMFQTDQSALGLSSAELQNRMVLLMVNEAARCLEERIVDEAADVDFGMIMGTGFAPFLGGPLRFADFVGPRQLVGEMQRLTDEGYRHFAPCQLLLEMAANGKRFYQEKGKQHENSQNQS